MRKFEVSWQMLSVEEVTEVVEVAVALFTIATNDMETGYDDGPISLG